MLPPCCWLADFNVSRNMPCVLLLGAMRRRIFRQVLVESVVLSLVGGAFGMIIANSAVNVLKVIGGRAVPRSDSVQVGWPVFAFGFAAALMAML